MLRYLRYAYLAVVAILFLSLALANRQSVPVRLLPEDLSALLNFGHAVELPLFVLLLAAVAFGVLIGFVWEWMREHRIRVQAKQQTKAVARLERELAVMQDSNSVPQRGDEVLALLERGSDPRP